MDCKIVKLTEYQKRWITDKSRFKIGVISRQGGKSFSTSLEACIDCIENPGSTWVFLSAGERQSKELVAKAAMHLKALSQGIKEIESDYLANDVIYKKLEIVIPHSGHPESRIIGLPANPDTAVGWSANILLDEFAKHRDSREIWKAMFPTVTRGYKIRIISTFKGKNNKFYDLFYAAPTLQRYTGNKYELIGERGGWSKHFIDIYQAVEMGLELKDDEGKKIEPEDLRLALADQDTWEEDFECKPSDEASSFLSHALIASCEDIQLNPMPAWANKLFNRALYNYKRLVRELVLNIFPDDIFIKEFETDDFYVGVDIGRKRDLTVIWIDELKDNILKARAVIELRQQPFWIQEYIILSIMNHEKFARACIDETGLGAHITENSINRYGRKVEGITFTSANKEKLAFQLKENLEDKKSRIPVSNVIRNSLHSVKKYTTSTKHFRFDAEKTDETGHADHFWAKALAIQAASKPKGGNPGYQGIKNLVSKYFKKGAY